MIDFNKPIETTDGVPATVVKMDYRITDGVHRALVVVHLPTHDTVHFVSHQTGKTDYESGVEVRNVSED